MVYVRKLPGYETDHVEKPRFNKSLRGYCLQMVTETGQAVQISIHPPSPFICVITHPNWGSAVYPSILMSSASLTIIKQVLKRVAAQHGWK